MGLTGRASRSIVSSTREGMRDFAMVAIQDAAGLALATNDAFGLPCEVHGERFGRGHQETVSGRISDPLQRECSVVM